MDIAADRRRLRRRGKILYLNRYGNSYSVMLIGRYGGVDSGTAAG